MWHFGLAVKALTSSLKTGQDLKKFVGSNPTSAFFIDKKVGNKWIQINEVSYSTCSTIFGYSSLVALSLHR